MARTELVHSRGSERCSGRYPMGHGCELFSQRRYCYSTFASR